MLQKSKNSLIKLSFPSKKKKGLSHSKNFGEPSQFNLLHHRLQPAYMCRNPKIEHVFSFKVLHSTSGTGCHPPIQLTLTSNSTVLARTAYSLSSALPNTFFPFPQRTLQKLLPGCPHLPQFTVCLILPDIIFLSPICTHSLNHTFSSFL